MNDSIYQLTADDIFRRLKNQAEKEIDVRREDYLTFIQNGGPQNSSLGADINADSFLPLQRARRHWSENKEIIIFSTYTLRVAQVFERALKVKFSDSDVTAKDVELFARPMGAFPDSPATLSIVIMVPQSQSGNKIREIAYDIMGGQPAYRAKANLMKAIF